MASKEQKSIFESPIVKQLLKQLLKLIGGKEAIKAIVDEKISEVLSEQAKFEIYPEKGESEVVYMLYQRDKQIIGIPVVMGENGNIIRNGEPVFVKNKIYQFIESYL